MSKEVVIKLEQIAECIKQKVKSELKEDFLGLFNGGFGVLLFLSYFAKYKNSKSLDKLIDVYLERLLEKLGSNIITHTYSSGLSGILYLIKYLDEMQLARIDLSDAEDMLDGYLSKMLNIDILNKNFDLMHGAIGVGLYFLKKEQYTTVDNIVNFLYNIAEKEDTIIKWKSTLFFNPPIYNISLSHGICGIVAFLCKVLEKNYNEKATEMLNGAIMYLSTQEIDYHKYGSLYPSYSTDEGITRSRLGWCYGDLGVGLCFWRASEVLKNEQLKNKALEIFYKSATRLQDSTVVDTCLCHGTSGLYMFFKRIYIDLGEEIFKETADHWLLQTLKYSTYNDGLAGYKTYEAEGWHNNYSLLSGITGVGLVFLSYIMNDKQSWDELFLLS